MPLVFFEAGILLLVVRLHRHNTQNTLAVLFPSLIPWGNWPLRSHVQTCLVHENINPDIFIWSPQVLYHPEHISICRNLTFWTDVHKHNCSPLSPRPVPCNGNFLGFCRKERGKRQSKSPNVASGSNVSPFEFTETRLIMKLYQICILY